MRTTVAAMTGRENWELLCVEFLGLQEKATWADPILKTGERILVWRSVGI
jgi:hypothetical protein